MSEYNKIPIPTNSLKFEEYIYIYVLYCLNHFLYEDEEVTVTQQVDK